MLPGRFNFRVARHSPATGDDGLPHTEVLPRTTMNDLGVRRLERSHFLSDEPSHPGFLQAPIRYPLHVFETDDAERKRKNCPQ